MARRITKQSLPSINDRPRFPAGTHGFWYYHRPPNVPPAAGEVRFRITDSRSPASFDRGRDLLSVAELPYAVSLPAIARFSDYEPFAELLRREGLVSESCFAKVAQVKANSGSTIIHSVDQPFYVDLAAQRTRWKIAHEEDLYPMEQVPAYVQPGMRGHRVPMYSGAVHMRFERASTAKGEPALVIRTVKIIDSPICVIPGLEADARIRMPTVGELALRRYGRGEAYRPWMFISASSGTRTPPLSYLLHRR